MGDLFWKVMVLLDRGEVGTCLSAALGCFPLYLTVITFECGEFIVFKGQIIISVLTSIGSQHDVIPYSVKEHHCKYIWGCNKLD